MMNNTVVESKTCAHCQSHFEITQSDLDFYDKISPKFSSPGEGGVDGVFVAKIPTPTLCPDCRQRRRLSFRNERKLYRRQCDASQKSIISIYSPDKPYKVYDQTIWWSDSRDPMDYGMDFDFGKSFTENFRELMIRVPRMASINVNPHNSEYINCAANNQDCYLCFDLGSCKNCLYSRTIYNSQDIVDSLYITDSSNCFECVRGERLYNCLYTFYCSNSSDLVLCNNCNNCSHCYLCNNLSNQQYCISNQQYNKKDYLKLIPQIIGAQEKNQYKSMLSEQKFTTLLQCENCTGTFQRECSKCSESHGATICQDSKFLLDCYRSSNSYDNCFAGIKNTDYTIENIGCEDAIKMYYALACFSSTQNSYYVDSCHGCNHCFACIGLRNKQYCIFNKQYENKEKYEEQVNKIIQHMMTTGDWGEFFHPSLSPFGYNETVAQEYFPIKGGELTEFGYKWSSYEAPTPQVDKVIKGQDLPETIQEVSDDILKVAILCEISGKPFRIIPQELAFYRKHNIPLPRKHPDVRHLERMKLRK